MFTAHFLLQGIFPTQGSNLGLPHCRQTLYPLSYQGSPSSSEAWPNLVMVRGPNEQQKVQLMHKPFQTSAWSHLLMSNGQSEWRGPHPIVMEVQGKGHSEIRGGALVFL